jgi:hypothetical protein
MLVSAPRSHLADRPYCGPFESSRSRCLVHRFFLPVAALHNLPSRPSWRRCSHHPKGFLAIILKASKPSHRSSLGGPSELHDAGCLLTSTGQSGCRLLMCIRAVSNIHRLIRFSAFVPQSCLGPTIDHWRSPYHPFSVVSTILPPCRSPTSTRYKRAGYTCTSGAARPFQRLDQMLDHHYPPPLTNDPRCSRCGSSPSIPPVVMRSRLSPLIMRRPTRSLLQRRRVMLLQIFTPLSTPLFTIIASIDYFLPPP